MSASELVVGSKVASRPSSGELAVVDGPTQRERGQPAEAAEADALGHRPPAPGTRPGRDALHARAHRIERARRERLAATERDGRPLDERGLLERHDEPGGRDGVRPEGQDAVVGEEDGQRLGMGVEGRRDVVDRERRAARAPRRDGHIVHETEADGRLVAAGQGAVGEGERGQVRGVGVDPPRGCPGGDRTRPCACR